MLVLILVLILLLLFWWVWYLKISLRGIKVGYIRFVLEVLFRCNVLFERFDDLKLLYIKFRDGLWEKFIFVFFMVMYVFNFSVLEIDINGFLSFR